MKSESRWTNLIAPFVTIGCLFYLLVYQAYASGYGYQRFTIWSQMKLGYKMEQGEWMFGYAVPFIVLGLLWVTRDQFKGIEVKWSWLGVPVLLLAFFCYFGGYKANQKYIGYGAMHLMIGGAVIWHFGLKVFLKGLWLYILLGMMWPWIFLIDKISLPLQKIMTTLTAGVMTLLQEDFIKEGTMIRSAPTEDLIAGERFSLAVAAACSGLRSFFALAMISLLYGYITLKKDVNRLVLFLSSGVFAIAGNLVRMMLLYWGTLLWGKEFAIGRGEHDPSHYHIGAGLAVFVVALIGMVSLSAFLERKKNRKVVRKTQG